MAVLQSRTDPKIVSQHYRMLELSSRIESASPHQLVGLLYEELLRALDLASVAALKGTEIAGSSHVTKALSILIALEASLDMEKGGDLARTLARIYRACSQGLNDAARTSDSEKLADIRQAISGIAYAWQALAAD